MLGYVTVFLYLQGACVLRDNTMLVYVLQKICNLKLFHEEKLLHSFRTTY